MHEYNIDSLNIVSKSLESEYILNMNINQLPNQTPAHSNLGQQILLNIPHIFSNVVVCGNITN